MSEYLNLNVICVKIWVVAAVVVLLRHSVFQLNIFQVMSSLAVLFSAWTIQNGFCSRQPSMLMTYGLCCGLPFPCFLKLYPLAGPAVITFFFLLLYFRRQSLTLRSTYTISWEVYLKWVEKARFYWNYFIYLSIIYKYYIYLYVQIYKVNFLFQIIYNIYGLMNIQEIEH